MPRDYRSPETTKLLHARRRPVPTRAVQKDAFAKALQKGDGFIFA